MKQQKTFEKTYQQIIKELDENNILLINDQSLSKKQIKQLDAYYNLILKHAIVPIILDKKTIGVFYERNGYVEIVFQPIVWKK
jgi:polyphosphate kinase